MRIVYHDHTARTLTWEDKQISSALNRVVEKFRRRRCAWTPEADAYVRLHYNKPGSSAAKIAKDLRHMFGERYTKNSVISRWHRKLQ